MVSIATSTEFGLYAVGSLEELSIIDPRAKYVWDIPSQDESWGMIYFLNNKFIDF